MINRHEGEGRIDLRVHNGDVQLIDRIDRLPIMDRGAAKRIHAQHETRLADDLHVDHVPKVLNIGQDEIFLTRGCRLARLLERHALDAGVAFPQQCIRTILRPFRHIGIGWSAVGRVVLDAPVFRRVMRGRDNDTVREMRLAAAVVDQDGS